MKHLLRAFLAIFLTASPSWAAFAHVANLGVVNSTSAGTSFVLELTAQLDAANVGLLVVGFDNNCTSDTLDTSEVATVVDSASNTWAKLVEFCTSAGAANDEATVSLWRTKATANLAIGGTITITLANSKTSKAATLHEFTVGAGKTASIANKGTCAGLSGEGCRVLATSGTTPGSMALTGLPSKEYLLVRPIAEESTNCDAGTTANYTAITGAIASTGTDATSMCADGEFRILTGTGDTSNPAGAGVTRQWASAFVALEEVDVAGAPARRPIAPIIFQ